MESSATAGPAASGYVHRLIQTLLSLAAKGECVILGRGAAQALPPQTTLRVRLVAHSGGPGAGDPEALERQLRSVTSNTRADGREFLGLRGQSTSLR